MAKLGEIEVNEEDLQRTLALLSRSAGGTRSTPSGVFIAPDHSLPTYGQAQEILQLLKDLNRRVEAMETEIQALKAKPGGGGVTIG